VFSLCNAEKDPDEKFEAGMHKNILKSVSVHERVGILETFLLEHETFLHFIVFFDIVKPIK
jgi:hypothetical protein